MHNLNMAYCNDKCPIGISMRNKFLDENNSAFDAVTDFRLFVGSCFESCKYKNEHIGTEEVNCESI